MKKVLFLLLAIFGIFYFYQENIFAMTADEIVTKANRVAYYSGSDGRAHVKMVVTDKQGRERVREFVILRKNEPGTGEQKYYVYFQKPEDVRGMVYMVWKHLSRDDDRWLYLPALDLVRRVSSSDKRSSFVGSNFVYEDISGRGLNEDEHVLLEETDLYYKVGNTPRDKNAVEFDHYDVWIDRKTYMPVKAQYFDVGNKLIKEIEALKVEEVKGYPTVIKSIARDKVSGGSTVSEFSGIDYDIGLTDDIFTERYLRRPAQKWLE
ncbi:MAG: outer membrane lipoprotein-sorting protein [Candidatus Omnitrophota bacterium]